MWFGIHLVRSGKITAPQLVDAMERQLESQVQIGHLAVSRGLMTFDQVREVLLHQAESQLPFGRIAVLLGYLNDRQLADLLLAQSNSEPPLWEVLAAMDVLPESEAKEELTLFRQAMSAVVSSAEEDAKDCQLAFTAS